MNDDDHSLAVPYTFAGALIAMGLISALLYFMDRFAS